MLTLLVLIIILFTPLWATLAHDIWQLQKSSGGLNWDELIFSDLGWMWVTYHPASYNKYSKTAETEVWENYIDPLLHQDAILIAAGFSLFLCLVVVPFHLKGMKRHEEISALDNDDGYSFSSIRRDMDKR